MPAGAEADRAADESQVGCIGHLERARQRSTMSWFGMVPGSRMSSQRWNTSIIASCTCRSWTPVERTSEQARRTWIGELECVGDTDSTSRPRQLSVVVRRQHRHI